MANPQVVVEFVADTKRLQAGAASASGATGGLGSKLKDLGKTAAVAAGAAGFAALVASVKIGIDEFAESQKVAAQTEAVIKSTGGAANVTAKQVTELAESLMTKSGVDDELIASGENVLLTFRNIRNEAGKGNDVFNQATKATLDMSVALGKDMKSSALLVGKALNDPIKGMSALSRAGVQFTDGQKKMITRLVESGDTMGAQKIILKELQKEFGGSAEAAGKTLPGQLKILKEQFSNLAGTIVGELAPEFTKLLTLLLKHKTTVVVVIAAMTALAVVIGVVKVATMAWAAATKIAAAVTKAWAAVQWLLNAAMMANPIGIVIIAIVALVAAFIIAYKTSDKFRAIVDKAFKFVLTTAKTVFNWLKSNWPLIVGILTGPMGIVVVMMIRNWGRIKDAVTSAVRTVKSSVGAAWNWIKSATSSAWAAVKNSVSSVIDRIKDLMRGLVDWISNIARGVLAQALARAGNVFSKIADGAKDAYNGVKNWLNNIVNAVGNVVSRVASAAGRIASAIKNPINAVIRAWNSITFTLPRITIPSVKIAGKKIGGGSFGGQSWGTPDINYLAKGGVVSSPTLAMVGEGRGREIVAPESLLRDIVGASSTNVRVFIGDTELRGIVRAEVDDSNTGIARTLLAGQSGR